MTTQYAIVRFIDEGKVEIMKLESVPIGAHDTGRLVTSGMKEFLVSSDPNKVVKIMDIISKNLI